MCLHCDTPSMDSRARANGTVMPAGTYKVGIMQYEDVIELHRKLCRLGDSVLRKMRDACMERVGDNVKVWRQSVQVIEDTWGQTHYDAVCKLATNMYENIENEINVAFMYMVKERYIRELQRRTHKFRFHRLSLKSFMQRFFPSLATSEYVQSGEYFMQTRWRNAAIDEALRTALHSSCSDLVQVIPSATQGAPSKRTIMSAEAADDMSVSIAELGHQSEHKRTALQLQTYDGSRAILRQTPERCDDHNTVVSLSDSYLEDSVSVRADRAGVKQLHDEAEMVRKLRAEMEQQRRDEEGRRREEREEGERKERELQQEAQHTQRQQGRAQGEGGRTRLCAEGAGDAVVQSGRAELVADPLQDSAALYSYLFPPRPQQDEEASAGPSPCRVAAPGPDTVLPRSSDPASPVNPLPAGQIRGMGLPSILHVGAVDEDATSIVQSKHGDPRRGRQLMAHRFLHAHTPVMPDEDRASAVTQSNSSMRRLTLNQLLTNTTDSGASTGAKCRARPFGLDDDRLAGRTPSVAGVSAAASASAADSAGTRSAAPADVSRLSAAGRSAPSNVKIVNFKNRVKPQRSQGSNANPMTAARVAHSQFTHSTVFNVGPLDGTTLLRNDDTMMSHFSDVNEDRDLYEDESTYGD